jgi:NAD(P)-dependent dehydrogenase (short-subunit alcohol dehydrogenase family)
MAERERFAGKVAAVTGAASGIGLAIARAVVAEGGSVAAGDLNTEGLDSLAGELGGRCRTQPCDVTREAEVEALMAMAVGDLGRLDAAFNVAGGSRPGLIAELSEEDWDFTVDLCLKGVFLAMKHAAARMIAQGTGGAIVNISSLNSRVPMFMGSAYCASKAGVAMLAQCGALELGEHHIRVNAVSPGLTDTPLVRPLIDLPAAHQAYLERIPLRRAATPEDIARASLFLASDDAEYITGVNLFVDGGWEQTTYPDLRAMIEQLIVAGAQ